MWTDKSKKIKCLFLKVKQSCFWDFWCHLLVEGVGLEQTVTWRDLPLFRNFHFIDKKSRWLWISQCFFAEEMLKRNLWFEHWKYLLILTCKSIISNTFLLQKCKHAPKLFTWKIEALFVTVRKSYYKKNFKIT